MQEYKLDRTGDAPVKFTGELIAEGSSFADEGPRSLSWHEVDIYKTLAGRWIGQIYYRGGHFGGGDESWVFVANSHDDLRIELLNYEHSKSTSCRLALSLALEDDEIFVEEID
jgi:hypothetical protein